jgi:hypothetical protein
MSQAITLNWGMLTERFCGPEGKLVRKRTGLAMAALVVAGAPASASIRSPEASLPRGTGLTADHLIVALDGKLAIEVRMPQVNLCANYQGNGSNCGQNSQNACNGNC